MEVLEHSAKVLQQFAKGDGGAFEALFRQFQGEVYGWIVRIVRDPAAAEDLTIETFWKIHQAHARFDPERAFGAWARKIASNVALDYLKRKREPADLSRHREAWSMENLQAPREADPVEQRDLREKTARAFRQLPAKLQAVATLALIEERSHAEIAEALNISTAAVKSRMFRAVQLLRRKLQHVGVNYD